MRDNNISFTITYNGDALQNHTIDIKELAPALMSLGNLLDETNTILNGSTAQVKVHVKATSAGSFNIHFISDQNVWTMVKDLLTSQPTTAIINMVVIFGLVFGNDKNLIWLIEKLKGKPPVKIEDLKNGLLRLTFDNGTFDITKDLLNLYKSREIRAAVEGIVKPLKSDGISTFAVKKNNEQESVCEVKKDNVALFDVPPIQDEELLSSEREIIFTPISISFKEGNKWRLFDGLNTVNVIIEDDIFVNKIKQNLVAFSSSDTLRCRVKIIQKQTAEGLKTEYEILEVIEHIPGYKQLNLF
jgi:hypothetical protein